MVLVGWGLLLLIFVFLVWFGCIVCFDLCVLIFVCFLLIVFVRLFFLLYSYVLLLFFGKGELVKLVVECGNERIFFICLIGVCIFVLWK